jgi:hypothetical protein
LEKGAANLPRPSCLREQVLPPSPDSYFGSQLCKTKHFFSTLLPTIEL